MVASGRKVSWGTSGRVEMWLWVGYALRRGATDKQRPNGFRSNVSVSTVGLYPGLIARIEGGTWYQRWRPVGHVYSLLFD